MNPVSIIELTPNGDPYGSGFWGRESRDGEHSWFFRGDVGAQSRTWWRRYCRKQNIRLREWRLR